MRQQLHPLIPIAPGTQRVLSSFHFGVPGAGGKAYIQASLHADELPGMLVAHRLMRRLEDLEARGLLTGEVVVVPVANPIGLSQRLLHGAVGRFDFNSGENFNRHYPTLSPAVADRLRGKLGDDAPANVAMIRGRMRASLEDARPATELESLRHALMWLAADADVVLDLHCDTDAVLHLYTLTPLWSQCEPLARYLGARATLLSTESGDHPFDEACSRPWLELSRLFPEAAIPLACLAVTVELRGQSDVDARQAGEDADRLVEFLALRGIVDIEAPPLPPLAAPPTPLEGSEAIVSPGCGIVCFAKRPGDMIATGDIVAEIIDPLSGASRPVAATTSGVLYARDSNYFAVAGTRLAKVAGSVPFRSGRLLSA